MMGIIINLRDSDFSYMPRYQSEFQLVGLVTGKTTSDVLCLTPTSVGILCETCGPRGGAVEFVAAAAVGLVIT